MRFFASEKGDSAVFNTCRNTGGKKLRLKRTKNLARGSISLKKRDGHLFSFLVEGGRDDSLQPYPIIGRDKGGGSGIRKRKNPRLHSSFYPRVKTRKILNGRKRESLMEAKKKRPKTPKRGRGRKKGE